MLEKSWNTKTEIPTLRRLAINMSESLRKLLTILTPVLLVIAIAFISVILGVDISSIPKFLLIPGFFLLVLFFLYLPE